MRIQNLELIKEVSKKEHIPERKLFKLVKRGRVVILGRGHASKIAIGKQVTTKVNVNLGTSDMTCSKMDELNKALAAQKLGADTISDCSVGGNLDDIRKTLIRRLRVPVTSIPVYQIVASTKSFEHITDDIILKTIEKHVKDGVSSIVIYAGFKKETLKYLKKQERLMGIVSKGGSMTSAIILAQGRENPFFDLFDEILEILAGTDVILNLGNAMRSGAIHDLPDAPQFQEAIINSKLAKKANQKNIQVIIEGLGGHVNAFDLKRLVKKFNFITGYRPLFVAGPIPTEIGLGHDHISAAIGGALASGFGADYICAITPAEHLALPNISQIKEGIIAAKIAAHVGDSIKYGFVHSFDVDMLISKHRFKKDLIAQSELVIDPDSISKIRNQQIKSCTMCGKYCAIDMTRKYLLGDQS
ncbi:MAG: phosphomethylpyrimidine synthase ThiC [Promethearchaeota archaeon]